MTEIAVGVLGRGERREVRGWSEGLEAEEKTQTTVTEKLKEQ